jgi:hypothetical protein
MRRCSAFISAGGSWASRRGAGLTRWAVLAFLVIAIGAVGSAAFGLRPGAAAAEAARKVSADGFGMRRLTESQYRQSIADIFGPDIKISGRFEPDPRRDGLVAIGVANVAVGPVGFEQYDAAAREIAHQVTSEDKRAALLGCGPHAGSATMRAPIRS